MNEAATLTDIVVQLLGVDSVVIDADERAALSCDVLGGNAVAAFAIRPTDATSLGKAVARIGEAGFAMLPRGGGLSYTAGYVPQHERSVIVDCGALNQIFEIDSENLTITVGTGVTWRAIHEALTPLGLRLPFFGTFSGAGATVGGGLSNGALFMGTARHGLAADIVLGLEVVLANGDVVRTGQWAIEKCPHPVQRYAGPDLTGPFLHDCGAFGIKTAAVLKLMHMPSHSDFLSFAFDDVGSAARAVSDVARSGAAQDLYVFDPTSMQRRMAASDLRSDIRTFLKVITSPRNPLKGLAEGAKLAFAGKRFVGKASFAMHLSCAGRSAAAVQADMAIVRRLATAAGGREIANSIPKAIHADPFPHLNGIIGMTGGRWAALNAIVGHRDSMALVNEAEALIAANREELDRHEIIVTRVLIGVSEQAFLFEPVFHWSDSWLPMQRRAADRRYLATLTEPGDGKAARAVVERLRQEMMALFARHGAASLQIARAYPWLDALRPESRVMMAGLKSLLDPTGVMNPGSLGLNGEPTSLADRSLELA